MYNPKAGRFDSSSRDKNKGVPMNDESRKILGLIVLFGLLTLAFIAHSWTKMVRDLHPQNVIPKEEPIPTIVVPTPNKGYFVECMNDDQAIISADGKFYHYWCNRGKWTLEEDNHDQNSRDFKLPEPQRNDSGTI